MNNFTYNLLIFDLGWTLEDECYSQFDRAKKASKYCLDFGIDVSPERIIELQEEGGRHGISNVFNYSLSKIGLLNEQIDYVSKNSKWDTSLLIPYSDTKETLEALSRNYDLGIIANQSRSANNRLNEYDIFKYFKFVISSCDVGFEKPDRRIFKLALDKFGKLYKNIWMIGDRIDNDIIPTKELGLKTIRIIKGFHRLQEPKSMSETPDYTINNLNELLEIFVS